MRARRKEGDTALTFNLRDSTFMKSMLTSSWRRERLILVIVLPRNWKTISGDLKKKENGSGTVENAETCLPKKGKAWRLRGENLP
jgi:hypothetical protein